MSQRFEDGRKRLIGKDNKCVYMWVRVCAFLWNSLTIYIRACVLTLCIYILEFDATERIPSFSYVEFVTHENSLDIKLRHAHIFIHTKIRTHARTYTSTKCRLNFLWTGIDMCARERIYAFRQNAVWLNGSIYLFIQKGFKSHPPPPLPPPPPSSFKWEKMPVNETNV